MSLPLRNRLLFISFLVLCWSTLVVWRLYNLQVIGYEHFTDKAQRQQERTIHLNPKRGTIYDRNGRELAVSVDVASVYAVPSKIEDPIATAKKLSQVLISEGLSYKDILKKLKKKSSFVWIKRQISPVKWDEIKSWGIEGIASLTESKRYFPKKDMAAHVLGYVNIDNEGVAGIEKYYNDEIMGQPARMMVIRDAKGDRIVVSNGEKRKSQRGKNLYLTVDEIIQYAAERELDHVVRKYNAKSGTVIVMNPNNGEILALVNRPKYSPNMRFSSFPEKGWPNRAITDIYEPGSTFKVITAAAAFEEGVVKPDEVIYCGNGKIEVAGKIIKDHEKYADLNFREIIAHSSNVGTIKVGMRIGRETFFRYINSFGFGSVTGVDLPAESKGILRPLSRWSGRSLASIAMGQEVGVTALQMLNALNVVANGGYLFKPQIVKAIVSPDEQEVVEPGRDISGKRIISESTAKLLANVLTSVVEEGTAKNAFIDGYNIAGKTGTAQKVDKSGKYSASKFVASFMGFFPADNPQISMIVVIDEPKGASYYGGTVAAPVFRNIAASIIMYYGIPSKREDRLFRTVYRPFVEGEDGFVKAGMVVEQK